MADDDSSLQGDDASSNSIDGDVGAGKQTDTHIQTIKTLQKQVDHWKTTATTLSKLQQTEKDTLIANFTTLRNQLEARHRAAMEALRRDHEAERREWEAQLEAAGGGTDAKGRTRRPRRLPLEALADSVREDRELFSGEVAAALAEGRPIPTDAADTERRRGPILAASDAVDMAQLLREQRAYNERRRRNRDGEPKDEGRRQDDSVDEGNRDCLADVNDNNESETEKPQKRKHGHLEMTAPTSMDTNSNEAVDPKPGNPPVAAGAAQSTTDDQAATAKANGEVSSSDADEWTFKRPRKG